MNVGVSRAQTTEETPLAQTLITAFVAVMLLIPARLVVTQLGGVGSPQELFGLGLLGLWLFALLRPRSQSHHRQPVVVALAVVVICFTISYVIAMYRPSDLLEYSTANLGFVALLSWAGVLLYCADQIPDQKSLTIILRRLTFVGGLLATLAILQFFTGTTLVDKLWYPGLSVNANQTLAAVGQRGGLNRPAGTAVHPIEFGAIVTMILPMAITLAIQERSRSWYRRWVPPLLLAFAVFMSISRSALLSAAVALGILWWAWSRKLKVYSLMVGVGFLMIVALAIPGMLGTLLGLFTTIGDDTSAASRTGSYPVAWEFIQRSPVFGRGFATFLPQIHILDNGLLGLAIEVGFAGLLAMLTLIVCGIWAGRLAWRSAPTEDARSLGRALMASASAGTVGLALYDGFGFPMGAAMIFLVLGLAAAARRIALEDSVAAPPDGTTSATFATDGHASDDVPAGTASDPRR